MKSTLTNLDMFSSEVYFTINSGNRRNKTIIGGIITILSAIAIISLTILFLIEFFNNAKSNVLSSYHSTESLNLPLHTYPFLLRLSTEKIQTYIEGSRLYTITLKLKVGGANNTSQWTDDIAMEQCDITKHFGDYSYLFANISDINTYLCPSTRYNNQSVIGVYGGKDLFQYYHFYITMCVNSTLNNNHCVEQDIMNKKLKATYLDVLSVDYNLDSNAKNEQPYEVYVRSDRHSISNTVYKRVWMYMESIDYYKDVALVFESNKLYSFFKVNSFRYDMDMRDMYNGVTIPGTFANLSVMNYNIKVSYYATYMKVQELCANVGGVSKIISVLCVVLNYMFSQSAYKEKIIGFMFEQGKEKEEGDLHVRKQFVHNPMIHNSGNNNNKTLLNVRLNYNVNANGNEKKAFPPSLASSNIVKHSNDMISNSSSVYNINVNNNMSQQHCMNRENKVKSTLMSLNFTKESSNNTLMKGDDRNSSDVQYDYNNNNNNAITMFDKVITWFMFNNKAKKLYYDNYNIINRELDIKYYLRLKRRFKQIEASIKKQTQTQTQYDYNTITNLNSNHNNNNANANTHLSLLKRNLHCIESSPLGQSPMNNNNNNRRIHRQTMFGLSDIVQVIPSKDKNGSFRNSCKISKPNI